MFHPLILKIRKELHKNIAKAQDIIIEELYKVFTAAVLHGGTAIWRCYSGNRFSEDIDAYIPKDIKKIEAFFKNLEKKGFVLEKKKIGENSIYSKLSFNRTIVRFEALFKKIDGSLKEYESVDGNLITIYTLTPEEFIEEKTAAYLNRHKVRDLYDIFFLLRYIQNAIAVEKHLKNLLRNYKNPIDENELKTLILEGIVPKSQDMINYIQRSIRNGEGKTPK